jgi:hypothetical protein
MNRKAQSQIVGTVVLLLIVMSVGVILIAVIVPFVEERLAGTGCFDVTNQIELLNNPKYTCFNSSVNEIKLQVHFGDVDNKTIKGLMIVTGGADSDSFRIEDGKEQENKEVRNIGKSYMHPIEFPGKNTERTFIIKSTYPDNIKIHAILEGDKTCEQSDIIPNLPRC